MATTIKDRVARLESLVEGLTGPPKPGGRKKDWRRSLGRFTGDAVMKRIAAAALEYRAADRKKASRKRSKRRATKS